MKKPTNKKPTGFIARCQCGNAAGAMDFRRTLREDCGEIFFDWLISGYIIEPVFDRGWSVQIKSCECDDIKTEKITYKDRVFITLERLKEQSRNYKAESEDHRKHNGKKLAEKKWVFSEGIDEAVNTIRKIK